MIKASCVYVEFTGGTSAERGKVQAALDEHYNDKTMCGSLDVALLWRVDRWQILRATTTAPTVGLVGIPEPELPSDERAAVRALLIAAGIAVEYA